MENKDIYRSLFALSSDLTDIFPESGGRILNWALTGLLGSSVLSAHMFKRNSNRVRDMKSYQRMLVMSDLNIGDALFAQAIVSSLRDYFPSAEIDLVIGAVAQSLVQDNTEIDHVLPILRGAPFPAQSDFANVKRLSLSGGYDLLFSCSPFFRVKKDFGKSRNTIDFTPLAAMLVRGERFNHEKNHVVFQMHRFIHDLFSGFMKPKRTNLFRGVSVTLSDEAINTAQQFLKGNDLYGEGPKIMFNPDASTRFTAIPFEVQVSLLKKLTRSTYRILLGGGHTNPGIENRLLKFLSGSEQARVTIVPPSTPIDAYAALIDFADVYISGDAGPLHIAAANKRSSSGNYDFRNRTAVFSIFGATPARIYGYDSRYPNFFPANQDAPSHAYISQSPCRNITCINKMAKTCRTLRCFQFVDTDRIASDISMILKNTEPSRAMNVSTEEDESL